MARSHPPTLLTLASRTLREECALGRGARLLAAVSGGPDSLAMLDVLARLAPKLGFELVAHGVDHGLRPEAAAELDLAETHAARLGVHFTRTSVRVAPGGNLQARARALRYEALEAAREHLGATLIATAHHADDRAETVLLRLLRGAGPKGLAVLPPRAGDRIRPLLRARKADILAHLERHRIAFAEDPSNRDRRYLRARVREEVLPLLAELSPGIVGHLNALADELLAGEKDEALARLPAMLGLGRAQRTLLRRALERKQRDARVLLKGGWEARVDCATSMVRVNARPMGGRRAPGEKDALAGGSATQFVLAEPARRQVSRRRFRP
jgi:tRNA(Ile)-lysidine synthase